MLYGKFSYLYFLKKHLKRYCCFYCPLTHNYSLIFSRYLLNCHGTNFFSQIPNLLFCNIFKHKFFAAVQEIHKLQFWSTITNADTKFLSTKTIDHWKMEHYRGSANCGEVDLDSEVNFLDSDNLRQCTTVPCQYGRLPWTWTWCLLYLDRWYHINNRLGIV